MATLNGKKVSESYKDLLQVSNSNSGVDATLRTVEDGEGTSAGIQLSATDTSFNDNYILKEQGRQYHVANTMSSPYYRFDGTNDYITLGDNDKLHFNEKLSISLWVKCDKSTIATGGEVLIAKYDGTGNKREYSLYFTDEEKLEFAISSDGGDNAIGRKTSVLSNLDKWNHIVLVWDGDAQTIKIYMNGIDQGTLTGSGTIPTTTANLSAPLVIGAGSTFSDNFYGDIAGVKLFNESLSATEVKDLYSGGSVPFKYQGADNTHRVTNSSAYFVSTDGGTTSSTTTSMEFRTSGSSWGFGSFRLSSNLEKGKKYRLTFQGKSPVGSGTILRYGTAENSTDAWHAGLDGIAEGGFTAISGFTAIPSTITADDFEYYGGEFVCRLDTVTHITFRNYGLGDTITTTIQNFDIREIGCVAEFDGTGVASDKWLDKSGNDLYGTVSGATVANAPSGDDGLVYEEGTFTPTWTGGYTGTITYNTSHTRGRYVRVGDQMTVWIDISVSSATSNSDQLTFELPANARAVHNNYVGKIYFQTTSGTLGGTSNILRCNTASADATVYVHQQTTSGNANVTGAMLGNGTVNIYMSYLLA